MGKNKTSDRSKTNKQKHNDDTMIQGDDSDRFDASKPQFREPKEKSTKVVLDERFASVLTDPKFQLNVRDKYGRGKTKKEAMNELKAFYDIQDEEAEKAKDDDDVNDKTKQRPDSRKEQSAESDHESSPDDGVPEDPMSRISYLTALSRGELDVSSSSDEDEGDEDDHSRSSDEDGSEDEDVGIMGKAGILDPSTRQDEEIELTTEESPYLVIQDMDWSHVRAVDIFAVVSSFAAPGAVKRVRVYASDFGMERMEKEERFGPSDLWKKKSSKSSRARPDDPDASDEDSSQGEDDEVDVDETLENDFDPEKLRAYEASRLKYYFAIVEMASPSHADTVYKEVDGMEFEHSSAALDIRAVPAEEVPDITKDRPLRDEASSIPSNYEPPEFVVSALQQTNVQCTWEAGDRERERTLTKYATSGEDWRDIAESDDIKAYLGSDASSDEDEEETAKSKASRMRQMLGLDNDDDSDRDAEGQNHDSDDEQSSDMGADKNDSFLTFDDDNNDGERDGDKEVAFVPGAETLEDKIRSSIEKKKGGSNEPTPWEQYLEKKKQKRKERKAAARAKREEINESRRGTKNSVEHEDTEEQISRKAKRQEEEKAKAELELLVADGGDDEELKDYDMHKMQRVEKNKSKKLKGARKRKEAALEADLLGTGFKVDVDDSRFKAVLDGTDDRFGIDRTDPSYKETTAMREIMAEQTRRRKKRKTRVANEVAPDVSAETGGASTGASALSSLVSRLKQKVSG